MRAEKSCHFSRLRIVEILQEVLSRLSYWSPPKSTEKKVPKSTLKFGTFFSVAYFSVVNRPRISLQVAD